MAAARPRKRCVICRRWYRPDAKVKDRQRACHRKKCQRELHRRNCERYNERERVGRHVQRLRSKLKGPPKAAAPLRSPPEPPGLRRQRETETEDGARSSRAEQPFAQGPAVPGVDWKAVEVHFGLEQAVLWEVVIGAIVSYLLPEMREKARAGTASGEGRRPASDPGG